MFNNGVCVFSYKFRYYSYPQLVHCKVKSCCFKSACTVIQKVLEYGMLNSKWIKQYGPNNIDENNMDGSQY